MKWRRGVGGRQIEDRRGSSMGGLPIPIGAKGGLGGIGLIIAIIVILFRGGVVGGGGGDFDVPSLDPVNQMPGAQGGGLPESADPDADLKQFVGFVVDDVQDSLARAFAAGGQKYEATTLVLFSDATQSGCGPASSSTGPFYCPADRNVYLDLGFFRELRDRFGAPGDFAQAYVIAHEPGHHVQNLIGVSEDVRREQQAAPGAGEPSPLLAALSCRLSVVSIRPIGYALSSEAKPQGQSTIAARGARPAGPDAGEGRRGRSAS